jgi:CHASE3 domain sensor protein
MLNHYLVRRHWRDDECVQGDGLHNAYNEVWRNAVALHGIGLAILLLISAASIGMDIKARDDVAWVEHTLDVLNKVRDLRLLVHRAESASRGFVSTGDGGFATEFRAANAQIPSALPELKEAVSDDAGQTRLIESIEPVLARRLAINVEFVRLYEHDDAAAAATLMAEAEGRRAIKKVTASLDQFNGEERRLLAVRSTRSLLSGRLLLGTDLIGVLLILILGAFLTRGAILSTRALTHR